MDLTLEQWSGFFRLDLLPFLRDRVGILGQVCRQWNKWIRFTRLRRVTLTHVSFESVTLLEFRFQDCAQVGKSLRVSLKSVARSLECLKVSRVLLAEIELHTPRVTLPYFSFSTRDHQRSRFLSDVVDYLFSFSIKKPQVYLPALSDFWQTYGSEIRQGHSFWHGNLHHYPDLPDALLAWMWQNKLIQLLNTRHVLHYFRCVKPDVSEIVHLCQQCAQDTTTAPEHTFQNFWTTLVLLCHQNHAHSDTMANLTPADLLFLEKKAFVHLHAEDPERTLAMLAWMSDHAFGTPHHFERPIKHLTMLLNAFPRCRCSACSMVLSAFSSSPELDTFPTLPLSYLIRVLQSADPQVVSLVIPIFVNQRIMIPFSNDLWLLLRRTSECSVGDYLYWFDQLSPLAEPKQRLPEFSFEDVFVNTQRDTPSTLEFLRHLLQLHGPPKRQITTHLLQKCFAGLVPMANCPALLNWLMSVTTTRFLIPRIFSQEAGAFWVPICGHDTFSFSRTRILFSILRQKNPRIAFPIEHCVWICQHGHLENFLWMWDQILDKDRVKKFPYLQVIEVLVSPEYAWEDAEVLEILRIWERYHSHNLLQVLTENFKIPQSELLRKFEVISPQVLGPWLACH